jgi:cell division protein ZapA (FtsZ GTPase activity inhibitor)
MTAQRVIAAVEPLLDFQIKQARRHGLDEITIPLGRAINIMHDLQHLKDTVKRERQVLSVRKEPTWLQ